MTIDRHPLQAQGAGQAERRIPDDAVVPYCDRLGERLGHLVPVLDEEQREGRISAAAARATQAFLQELRGTIMVMALKHGRQLLDVETVPLTIDPTESGMPTFKDFWTLRDDCEHAQAHLAQLPSREALIEQATDTIFRGQRPVKQQILWLERAYMARLAETPVVADFRILDPVLVGPSDDDDQIYAISWTGVLHSVNLFQCVTLHVIERDSWRPGGGVKALPELIGELEGGRHALQEMLGLCNQAASIIPQLIERVTIGPYHHQWTENDQFVQRAFAGAHDEEPWMLRCSVERAATTRAIERSVGDIVMGRLPMEAGPSMRSGAIVVPLRIKQHLGDMDEAGNPSVVYGVSNDGDLVR